MVIDVLVYLFTKNLKSNLQQEERPIPYFKNAKLQNYEIALQFMLQPYIPDGLIKHTVYKHFYLYLIPIFICFTKLTVQCLLCICKKGFVIQAMKYIPKYMLLKGPLFDCVMCVKE